ncbi:hypothetical protein CMO96_02780 [Candidatus Woesebacteria bacterium]|nr:hypothetical protein [Candidatus Woesebacteria bacterium]
MNFALWIPIGAVIIIALFVWSLYNSLVTARVRIREAWSGIDVQLKRRADLIPNLIEAVKGYVKHEKTVLENVTKARTAALNAKSVGQKEQADNMLTGALKTLFAVSENYPKLQASANFKQLQEELSDVEEKIAYSRQFYNSNVMDFNTKIQIFPNNLIAGNFGFKRQEFFEADQSERENVKVKF